MSKHDQLRRLQQVASLMFDSRLAQLKTTARAMQETRDHLANLATAPEESTAMPPIAMAVAALRYYRWTDVRRADLNLTLARQTADWLNAREAARAAFGKTQALEAVKARISAASARHRS